MPAGCLNTSVRGTTRTENGGREGREKNMIGKVFDVRKNTILGLSYKIMPFSFFIMLKKHYVCSA